MKKFTKSEIDEWRNIFIKRKYKLGFADLDNRSINYFLMSNDIFGGIPNGLLRMTGDPRDGYLVGVSDEVPKTIRPHFAMSEHDEFMIYGLEDDDRTLHSEENMLRVIGNNEIRGEYVDCKLELYRHMLSLPTDTFKSWEITKNDLDGFVRAYDFLRGQ